jgi:methyl-accepting chemotaxis protein
MTSKIFNLKRQYRTKMGYSSTMIISALKNWHNRTNAASSPSWRDRLLGANQILHEMAASTEGEFIQLGEKLQEFYFRTKGLSELSSQVAKCLSGEELKQNMDGLQTVFDQVQEQDELSGKGIAVLTSLLSRFETIIGRLSRFDHTIRNLNVLCNFIKIESARLGSRDTGFNALGEQVRKLAGDITTKSAELLHHSQNIAEMIRQGLQRMSDFGEKQQGQARLILDQAVQNLADMTRHHQSSSVTLAEIATRWKRISQSIGEVVASMQFHDITRQRLEHVRDALRDVGEKIGPADLAETAENTIKLRLLFQKRIESNPQTLSRLAEAIVPCQVQSVQLKDANTDMFSAVGRIIDNLKRIASEVTVMAGEMKMLAGGGGQKEESFLSELEKKLSSLADALTSYGEINRQWSASMEVITAKAGNMTVFIHEIDKIGIQMRMVSLNASIHAAHLGQEGAALGILAESISRLSNETSREIDAISDGLRAVMAEAGAFDFHRTALPEEISSTDRTHRARQSQEIELSAQIEKMIAPLQQMDQNVSDLLNRIDHDAQALTQSIDTTIQGITVHKKISAEIHKVITELESMVAKMHALCPAPAGHSTGKELADMADRYTMEREREIHHAIAGTAAVLTAAAAVPEMTALDQAPETSTDNIEFFDDFLFADTAAPETAQTDGKTSPPEPEAQEILTETTSLEAHAEAEPTETQPEAQADEDLGDNVELF